MATASTTVRDLRGNIASAARSLAWLPPLFARLILGVVFVAAGWRKTQDLGKVTGFFTDLSIPYPAFNAAFVAYCELVCGALLLVGLLTRLATIPLIVIMIVAIVTAKLPELDSVVALLGLSELAFIALLLYLAISGPGKLSLDDWIARSASQWRARRRRVREPRYA